jgi:hypothetical protein
VQQRASEAGEAVTGLDGAWEFDLATHMTDARYLAELEAAAAAAGLRQLVDDAERMEGLFLVVLADEAFVDGDPRRSIDAYVALKMRIWADVQARGRDNPLAPLVRLEEKVMARTDDRANAGALP